ncbi:hypothetical protein GUJ93_ZPchr0004g39734 [Zizania palustris]|uniref:Uncharacterized protein n=1 Tax=Zizania palustris TaxID=103762 RepID=A0A8J5S5M8_ZIZPA|nr:hypothetical protein GUJ93_ZPchr0004g39734 [Zizania palustris]
MPRTFPLSLSYAQLDMDTAQPCVSQIWHRRARADASRARTIHVVTTGSVLSLLDPCCWILAVIAWIRAEQCDRADHVLPEPPTRSFRLPPEPAFFGEMEKKEASL